VCSDIVINQEATMARPTQDTSKSLALLTKVQSLPVLPRRTLIVRQFRDPATKVLCWYRSIVRHGRRYTMHCETQADGTREVTFTPTQTGCKPTRNKITKRHFHDPHSGRRWFY
jgi:hypothetical protein